MDRVIGLDLSLTSTGVAGSTWTEKIKPTAKLRGHERLDWILGRISEFTRGADMVVVEGPSFGSVGSGQHERGGLWWSATRQLWRANVATAVMPPTNLKQFITGKGSSGKDDVLREVTKRFPWFTGGNDEADALVLCAAGHAWLGEPIVALPEASKKALVKCQWPEDRVLAS